MVKLVVNNDRYRGIARDYPAYERDRIQADILLRKISKELDVPPYKQVFQQEYRPNLKVRIRDYRIPKYA